MYYSSWEEAILVANGSSWYLSVYQRMDENLDSLWFGMRYSVRGIATMSYVILYIMTRRLPMRLRSNRRQPRFRRISVTLEVDL